MSLGGRRSREPFTVVPETTTGIVVVSRRDDGGYAANWMDVKDGVPMELVDLARVLRSLADRVDRLAER